MHGPSGAHVNFGMDRLRNLHSTSTCRNNGGSTYSSPAYRESVPGKKKLDWDASDQRETQEKMVCKMAL